MGSLPDRHNKVSITVIFQNIRFNLLRVKEVNIWMCSWEDRTVPGTLGRVVPNSKVNKEPGQVKGEGTGESGLQ